MGKQVRSTTAHRDAEPLLGDIIDWYLSSKDFNGWPVRANETDQATGRLLEELLNQGLLQVVSERDYPNPHIRPWKSRREPAQQLEDLQMAVTDANRPVCVYPTPEALGDRLDPALHRDSPYRRRMAEGAGTLDLAYFSFDVLERYRNDPRYSFRYWDFGVDASIGDEAYLDESEPERDKTSISHIGFAYSFPEGRDGPVFRRVCAFMGDLADLTSAHQQYWRSFELEPDETEGLRPHPVWWDTQIRAQWPDGLGPFSKLLEEMAALNELTERAFGEGLFKTMERPEGLGWVLRPTQREWDEFIMLLDKLLSENIRPESLDAMGAPAEEGGRQLGSLARLERAIVRLTDVARDHIRARLSPLREVRKARQKPAHILRRNLTDKTLVRKQRDLMEELIISIQALRILWQQHPNNASWKPKPLLEEKFYTL